jgi:hypothetical protein
VKLLGNGFIDAQGDARGGDMAERPILFSAPMVRAILDGRKTVTRRAVKPQPPEATVEMRRGLTGLWVAFDKEDREVGFDARCRYGQPGDFLWVREAWRYWDWTEDGMPWVKYAADDSTKFFDSCIPAEWGDRLSDAWEHLSRQENYRIENAARDHRWRQSIHMPRWASRILLEVTGVRVERLQDISEEDARSEGASWKDFGRNQFNCQMPGWSMEEPSPDHFAKCLNTARMAFANFINKLHGGENWNLKPTNLWDSNPLVWVVSFKRAT